MKYHLSHCSANTLNQNAEFNKLKFIMNTKIKLIVIGFILMFVISSGNLKHAGAKNLIALKELPQYTAASDFGIKFDSMSLEKAKEEAQKSDKLIFIFAYTDWCGSCNLMNKTSLKGVEVGKLYNENFINLQIDIEKDSEGSEIAQLYGIELYPTLLFLDGNGKLIKQSVGKKTNNQLIAIANSVL